MSENTPYLTRRVALYARVSTSDQDTDRQQRDLRAYAARLGATVVETVIETASGSRADRAGRKRIMALAQSREIDAILVSELSRWSRSTIDLLNSLQDLAACNVSLMAERGMTFDLSTAQGRMLATVVGAFSEFERDLIRERVKSGMAAARARGSRIGRQTGERPSDAKAPKVLQYRAEGLSIAKIARSVSLSEGTVKAILKRNR